MTLDGATNMRNISEENIFRSTVWSAFGMDKEGQGYRACQNYGPMYKWYT